MKILVSFSKSPATTSKIAFKNNNIQFEDAGVQWIINPYGEWYALVRAIELKEKDATAVIHLITVGGADCDAIIRKALALGDNEAIRINVQNNNSYYIAAQIAEVVKQNSYVLILTGKESIDYNSSSIGGTIAELLDISFISLATKLVLEGGIATVTPRH